MGNLNQRNHVEIPSPLDGKSIFTCTIKKTINIAIIPIRESVLV